MRVRVTLQQLDANQVTRLPPFSVGIRSVNLGAQLIRDGASVRKKSTDKTQFGQHGTVVSSLQGRIDRSRVRNLSIAVVSTHKRVPTGTGTHPIVYL